MKIICSWCKKSMGEKAPLDNPSTTDGVCDECSEKLFTELREASPEVAQEEDETPKAPAETPVATPPQSF